MSAETELLFVPETRTGLRFVTCPDCYAIVQCVADLDVALFETPPEEMRKHIAWHDLNSHRPSED